MSTSNQSILGYKINKHNFIISRILKGKISPLKKNRVCICLDYSQKKITKGRKKDRKRRKQKVKKSKENN